MMILGDGHETFVTCLPFCAKLSRYSARPEATLRHRDGTRRAHYRGRSGTQCLSPASRTARRGEFLRADGIASYRESGVARKKTPQILVDVKAQVSNRLRDVRAELFGEHGGPELARRLNLPARTWYNYETGVTVPAEVLLGFIDQTGANPLWLLTGQGPRFRGPSDDLPSDDLTPSQLIRRSLDRLEQAARFVAGGSTVQSYVSMDVLPLDRVGQDDSGTTATLGQVLADRSWISRPEHTVAARIEDDAMLPILAAGSIVAVDLSMREPNLLSGRIAVARVQGRAVVRWLEESGRHVILRANAARAEFPLIPLELRGAEHDEILGQVVWSWSRFAEE
jgi:Peptidase S24-like